MNSYKIAVLNGDGIGPEVVGSSRQVLEAASKKHGIDIEFIELPIGLQAYKKFGRTLPPATLESMREADGCLLGPLQTGSYPSDDKDYPMASGKIRKSLDLYANIRPVKSLVPHLTSSRSGVDLIIVRENTEDFYPDRNLYKGYGEFWPDQDTVVSLRVVTRKACRRISETAFNLARARKKKNLVSVIHKANVLIDGDGLFLTEARKVEAEFPDVKLEEKLVDSAALELVLSPESFDVILTMNMFGDILSDEAAGLVGGLGLAPSLNAGEKYAVAQSVHGSAPDIAGRGIANPVAEILSSTMLLHWIYSSGKKRGDESLFQMAQAIENSVKSQLSSLDPSDRTQDLGGQASTNDFTSRLISRLEIGQNS
jgi:3-isopropylmalate dehydrogenase